MIATMVGLLLPENEEDNITLFFTDLLSLADVRTSQHKYLPTYLLPTYDRLRMLYFNGLGIR